MAAAMVNLVHSTQLFDDDNCLMLQVSEIGVSDGVVLSVECVSSSYLTSSLVWL